jgi:nucleotide-binding universal stress UspA family protein
MKGMHMSFKTILVHVDSGQRCSARVEVAIRLALQHDSHLVGLQALTPFEPPGYVMAEMGPAIIDAQRQVAASEIARAETIFTKQASGAGIRNVEWRTAIDDPVDAITLHARYADLIVIGQSDASDNSHTPSDFPERLVLAAGRPVLILPCIGSFPSIGKRILVAWNPSREATRAVTDAIPLLRLADNVHVMAVNPKAGEHGAVAGADIGLYLARHGVRVEVKTDQGAEIDVGNELLSRAADLDADLIVMGGYGHSRLKEWVLGGATRTILESMTVPVMMSH